MPYFPLRVKNIYEMLKLSHVRPNFAIVSLLLRCGRDLGEWAFLLLEDLLTCDTGKDCGYVLCLYVTPQCLDAHPFFLGLCAMPTFFRPFLSILATPHFTPHLIPHVFATPPLSCVPHPFTFHHPRLLNQFLHLVDHQLLILRPNLSKVACYLDSPSSSASAARFTTTTFARLCNAFATCHMWEQLLTLFQRCLRLLPSTRTTICQPLEAAIRHLGVSEKLMVVLERLTDEQKAGLSNQV